MPREDESRNTGEIWQRLDKKGVQKLGFTPVNTFEFYTENIQIDSLFFMQYCLLTTWWHTFPNIEALNT